MFKWLKKKTNQQSQSEVDQTSFSMDDLAAEFLSALKTHFPNDVYVYDKDTQMIEKETDDTDESSGDSSGIRISLDNFYNKLKNENAEERRNQLERLFAQFTEEAPASADEFKSQLFYRVRTSEEIANRTLYMNGMGAEDYTPLAAEIGDLRLEFVLDREDTLSIPGSDVFEEHGISPAEAAEVTQTNMTTVTTDTKWQAEDGFWISPFKDDYDGARVVALHPRGKLPVSGDPILFMPSHAICMVTDKIDAEIFAQMITAGESLAQDHRPLSKRFWTFGAGGWSPLTLAKDQPAYQLVHRQIVLDGLEAYHEQKRCLDEKYEKEDTDIFVAKYSAIQSDEGDVLSYAVLSLGVDTLLPKTDHIVFFDADAPEDNQSSEMLTWDQFTKIIGHKNMVEAKGFYPIRYDFIDRLKDADFARIRKALAAL